jgi:hypothetical protein
MSHITKVKTKLKDGHALRKALQRIGYRVQEGGIISTPYERGNGRAVEITAVKESCKLGFLHDALPIWHGQVEIILRKVA